jgi:hypothetical protein
MRVKNGRKTHALAVGAALATRHVRRKCVQFPVKIQLRSLESAALCVQVQGLTMVHHLTEHSFLGCDAAYFGRWVFSPLEMEGTGSSELLVSVYQTTWCHVSGDSRLHADSNNGV